MVNNHAEILNEKVARIIKLWNFFSDLKILDFILSSFYNMILSLEKRITNLSNCYVKLACVAAAMKNLPHHFNSEFRNHCIAMINKWFNEFDKTIIC